jgi:hypothetical protein
MFFSLSSTVKIFGTLYEYSIANESQISVQFMKKWTPNTPEALPLCKGFTADARRENKLHLYSKPLSSFGQLSPSEEPFTSQFGSTMQKLMKETLADWVVAMRNRIQECGPYKELRDRESVVIIMEHLRSYHEKYESIYGHMEEQVFWGKLSDNSVHIRSTGYGVKVLLGLMIADRLHVIDRLRREERERVCFERVDSSDLPADSKNCCICQDPLDTPTPEGLSEQGLKLIICCRQVIGENCLKSWLARSGPSIRKNCPNCRFNFPLCFLVKLFGDEYSLDVDSEEEEEDPEGSILVEPPAEVIDLVSPSPEPELERELRSPAPSPAPSTSIYRSMSLSPSAIIPPSPALGSSISLEVGQAEGMRSIFMNPVHTHIPPGPNGLPNFAAAWSFNGLSQVERADDFMMEG